MYRLMRTPFKSLMIYIALLGAFPAQAAEKMAAEKLILAFGDSLTAGYDLPASDSYPAQLQAMLRAQGLAVRVHNAGVSGDTSSGGRARLGWVVTALKTPPHLVILCLGANDSLRGLDPKLTRRNMDAMLAELKKQKINVLLVGMLAPPNMGKDYAKSYNMIFPELAKKYSTAYYPFLMNGVVTKPALLLADGMHPNKQGAAIVAKNLLPLTLQSLAQK
jgi:acyl-CoA thioesterase I